MIHYNIWVEAWGPAGQYFKMQPEVGTTQDVFEIDQMYRELVARGDVTNYKIHKMPTLKPNPEELDWDDVLKAPYRTLSNAQMRTYINALTAVLGDDLLRPDVKATYDHFVKRFRDLGYERTFLIRVLSLMRGLYDKRQKRAAKNKGQQRIPDFINNPPKQSVFDVKVGSPTWAKVISLKTPTEARKPNTELTRFWKKGNRNMQRKLRRMATLAAVRARIMSGNKNLKSTTRKDKKTIKNIYEKWVKAHTLPKLVPNPPIVRSVGLSLGKDGIVHKIYSDGIKHYRDKQKVIE